MRFLLHGLAQAWHMIINGNPYLSGVVGVTLQVVAVSTGLGALLGLPLGVAIGVGRFRGRNVALVLANVGLSLPPVLVGLVLSLLMFPRAPLGPARLLFTLEGVIVAQTVLAFPVVVALTASAVRSLSPGLLDQARAFGANRPQVAALALREARIGVLTALITAAGSGLSEVGAVVLVGGNIQGNDQTLASAALQAVNSGDFTTGAALGIILLGLIIAITAVLTALQRREPLQRSPRRTS